MSRTVSMSPADVRRLDAILVKRGWTGWGLTGVLRALLAEEAVRLGVAGDDADGK